MAALAFATGAEAKEATYVVAAEKDHSFGNIRSRITLEVEIPGTDDSAEQLKVMMQAAIDRHRQDWPDAVSVRLWGDYENDQVIQNSIDYAPDGCGWSGDPCSQPIWTDLFNGEIPADLIAFGDPTEAEMESSEDVACRQDLQCWGDKHALAATFACQPLIESLAKYAYRWTDGWLGAKLERFRWKDRKEGSISYTGDEVEFQNGFGAWSRMTYWCHYNPESDYAEVSVH
ncbi:MAG: hypothetical protein OXI81_00185 [Paracoccaceae bacterium]|nr:hypothetical protein [Paracoccaceae bacterium]